MLVLSRRINEVIVIETPSGEKIGVSVLEIRGNAVRLGFTADAEVKINRSELINSRPKGGAKS